MIARVRPRHNDLANLIWYLFKEGRDDDHADARLVAVWDGAGDLDQLEPPTGPDGRRDVRALVELLAQPLAAARNRPRLTVWHCPIRNAPEDRLLSDPVWAEIARQVMDATKLAPLGDVQAVRWIAVRHSPNHIHLAATLVRQDGYTAWGWRDKLNARQRCSELELRYGLRRVGPADRTGHRRPTGAELNKVTRLGRAVTVRDELRRHVRAAVAASTGEDEFFARLADAGVLVALRQSLTRPGEITGYSVALAGDTNAAGEPVFFGGGRLARDLTLPKLRQRWASPDGQPRGGDDPVRVSTQARINALHTAAAAVRGAADAIGHLADTNPAAAIALAQATADTLAAIAGAVEGRRGGPITTAVDLFDHAAREPNGAIAQATQRSWDLRAMSRLVQLMGRLSGDKDTIAMLALLLDLARLADTLATLRQAQQRHHQADAALRAAQTLRAVATTTGRLGAAPTVAALDLSDSPPPPEPAPKPVAEPSTPDQSPHRSR